MPLMPPGIPLPLLPLPLGAGAPRGHRTPELNTVQLRGGASFCPENVRGNGQPTFYPENARGFTPYGHSVVPPWGVAAGQSERPGGGALQHLPQQGHLTPCYNRLPKGLQIPRRGQESTGGGALSLRMVLILERGRCSPPINRGDLCRLKRPGLAHAPVLGLGWMQAQQ
jgi:hypothetical protein